MVNTKKTRIPEPGFVTPPLLVTVEGPTAIGKTAVAIELAEHFHTEIISTDSRQFFKEMKIGSAMPSDEQLKRVKHHFTCEKSVHDEYTVYQFENDAIKRLELIFLSKNIVIACGGSGLYMQALLDGIDELPDPSPELRAELCKKFSNEGVGFLQNCLFKLDPDYYNQVDKKNPVRLMRAIEVCISSGTTFSSLRTASKKSRFFRVFRIGLTMNRSFLFDRIGQRVDQMISDGFVGEAAGLLPCRDLKSLKTIGYPELFDVIEGKSELNPAIDRIKTNTKHYAKKQMTWLQKKEDIVWFHPVQTDAMIRMIKLKNF